MDLEEVYLRQIDQKIKQNNDLLEETNKISKKYCLLINFIIIPYSKFGDLIIK